MDNSWLFHLSLGHFTIAAALKGMHVGSAEEVSALVHSTCQAGLRVGGTHREELGRRLVQDSMSSGEAGGVVVEAQNVDAARTVRLRACVLRLLRSHLTPVKSHFTPQGHTRCIRVQTTTNSCEQLQRYHGV
jgi:hypothetical protein